MTTAPDRTPPYRLASWHLSAILAIAETGIIVFCLPLSTHKSGEAALGAMILLGVAAMVYVFHLVVITPFVAWHSHRRGTRLASRRSLWIIAPLVPAPPLAGLLFMVDVLLY